MNPQMQMMLTQPRMNFSMPVTATASFDPPVVGMGEKAVYRVTFNALESSVHFPPVPAPVGLNMIASAHGETLQFVGSAYHPVTSLNFHTTASRAGIYSILAYNVEVNGRQIPVSEARLEVVGTIEAGHEPARQLFLETTTTNVFVGQPIQILVLSPGNSSNGVEGLGTLQFGGDGFLADKGNMKQIIERREVGGRTVATFVAEARVIPMAAGEQVLTVRAFTSGGQFSGPIVIIGQATIPGGPARPVLLDSDPMVFRVRPLPSPATLGFTGFIGNLSADPAQLSTNRVRVGDALKLFVTFRSDDNLSRLVPPPPPRVVGWQIFPPMPAAAPVGPRPETPRLNNEVTFAYTMIPLTEEPQTTPAIPFSYFNPQKAAYDNLTIPGVPLMIVAEGLPMSSSVAIWSATNETASTKSSALSQLASSRGKTVSNLKPLQMRLSFVMLQLLPVFALLAIWEWDHRRRYLAAHPEIVRRRQALRALRRERRMIRHSVASGDAAEFLRSGVTALQIAAAPHYPAEPRALVCGEVLNLFSDDERDGRTGGVIRQFFASHDDANFGMSREHGIPLINLAPELESILQQLEAKL